MKRERVREAQAGRGGLVAVCPDKFATTGVSNRSLNKLKSSTHRPTADKREEAFLLYMSIQ